MSQCTAVSKRSRKQCKNWAIRGKSKCKFHGGKSSGAKSISGKERSKKGNFKHGFRSLEHLKMIKKIRTDLKHSIEFIKKIKY